jgi:sulfide dehydrogenase [flavocytochrome c] flavoprotein chain
MDISRRDLLKFAGFSVASAAVTGCAATIDKTKSTENITNKMIGHHQIVIIGGGFGGLRVAKELKKIDTKFDVTIIEKNDSFMSCPFSNCNLGGLKDVSLSTLTHDYSQAVEKNGYSILTAVASGIDRINKVVHTSKGSIGYDILILAPGIDYNYERQFPTWSEEKIAKAKRVAPAALVSGSEHVALDRMVKNMEENDDVVITVPSGKYRCPPAPFERASMIANYMKNKGLKGKVIILNETDEVATGAAFKKTWQELYPDIIDYHDNCKISDVDFDTKVITYVQTIYTGKEDIVGVETTKTIKYGILNLIPYNRSNSLIEMCAIATTLDKFKKVRMATSVSKPVSFQTASDKDIYAIGDVVGHAIPPSAQSAIWSAKECAKEIAYTLHGKSYNVASVLPYKSANVCYSMVNGNPEEAIMVYHEFIVSGSVIGSNGFIPHDKTTGKFRTVGFAKSTRDWYKGAMHELFD